jgi:hypothetical protein
MMQTDVLNASLTSSGVLFNSRQRIRQICFVGNATAGTITIYDNASAASGRVVWSIAFHTSNVPVSIDIPGEGILCLNGAYASLSNVVGFSVCYG